MLIIINVDSRCSSVGTVNRVGARKRRNPKNFPPKRPVLFWAHRASSSMCTVGHVHGIRGQEREAEHLPPYIADPIVFTRWDPKVCIVSCDSIDKNRPEDD